MNGATSMAKGFVEPTPQGHRSKECAHDTRVLAAAAIETALQRHPQRGLVVSVRFDSVEPPRHEPSSNLAKQRTALSFKRHSGFGCRLGGDKLVKEPGAPGEQPDSCMTRDSKVVVNRVLVGVGWIMEGL